MNGASWAGQAQISPPTQWIVAGTGDYNGDGKTDILWRLPTGELWAWFMNGSTYAGAAQIQGASPWTPIGGSASVGIQLSAEHSSTTDPNRYQMIIRAVLPAGGDATDIAKLDVNLTNARIRNNSRTFHASFASFPPLSDIQFDDDPAGVMVANTLSTVTKRSVDNISITNNEIGNISSIFQSYGVGFRISLEHNPANDNSSPAESMTGVTIGSNTLTNRQGAACKAQGIDISPANSQVQNCNNALQYTSVGCSTSGCQ